MNAARVITGVAATAVTAVVGMATAAPAGAAPATAIIAGEGTGTEVFVNGHFTIGRFGVDSSGHLLADGTLRGEITGPPGSTQKKIDLPIAIPVDRWASSGNCAMTDLALGPLHHDLAGYPVRLDRTNLHIEVRDGPGSRLLLPLCELDDVVRNDAADDARVAVVLNHMAWLLSGV